MKAQVGTLGDLTSGQMKEVRIEGSELLLARVGDEYLLADNRCPHMGGRLSQGKLDGTVVTCPLHGSRFDLRDGRVVRWTGVGVIGTGVVAALGRLVRSPRPLRVYRLEIEEDKLVTDLT